MKVAGFALLSIAIVATLLLVASADGYYSQRGFVWNLSNAKVFRTTEQARCPDPKTESTSDPFRAFVPIGCPRTTSEWERGPAPTYAREASFVSLGTVLAGTTALGLVGVGMFSFGGRKRE